MNTTVFDVLRALTSVAVFVVCMYVVPMIRRTVGESNLAIMEAWTANAVRYAEQYMNSETGEKKREVVVGILQDIRNKKHLDISDAQIDILIEAAVNTMNDINIQYTIEGDTND